MFLKSRQIANAQFREIELICQIVTEFDEGNVTFYRLF